LTLYNAGIPDGRFNIYVEFEADFLFTPESEPPGAKALFAIMEGLLTEEYITDYLRTLTGTPYESTSDVFLDDLSQSFSPQPITPSPQPVTFPPSSSIPSLVQTDLPTYRPTYESHIDEFFMCIFISHTAHHQQQGSHHKRNTTL
jgi:hypothetical protein